MRATRIVWFHSSSVSIALAVARSYGLLAGAQIGAGMNVATVTTHHGYHRSPRRTVCVHRGCEQRIEMPGHDATRRRHGNCVYNSLCVHNGVVLLHDSCLRQSQTHLVCHATLQLCTERIVAQHSPLRVFQRYALCTFRQEKPYLTHLVATLNDA